MVWVITSATFLATVGILVALVFAFSPSDQKVAGRLERLLDASAIAERSKPPAEKNGMVQRRSRFHRQTCAVRLGPGLANSALDDSRRLP